MSIVTQTNVPAVESNVIFLHVPHSTQTINSLPATDEHTFSEVPRGFPKKVTTVWKKGEDDVASLGIEELKQGYPGEWTSFRNMYYRRCGKQGYICHPSINTFPKFLLAFGPIPEKGWTVDRIDPNDVEYAPAKCEWASKQRQAENRRNVKRHNHSNGDSFIIPEWSRRTGIPAKTIYRRINELGWTVDAAVDTAVGGTRKSPPPQKNATGCNPKKGKPAKSYTFDDEYCILYGKSGDITEVFGPPASILNCWKKTLTTHYNQQFLKLEDKHRHIVVDCINLLEPDLKAEDVFSFIFKTWGDKHSAFCEYACARGAFKPPVIPTLNFIRQNINVAGNYYIDCVNKHKLEQLGDASMWLFPLDPRPGRRAYMEKFCEADPKYKKALKKLHKIESKKSSPEYGMTTADREAAESYYVRLLNTPDMPMDQVWEYHHLRLRKKCFKVLEARNLRSLATEAWEREQADCS